MPDTQSLEVTHTGWPSSQRYTGAPGALLAAQSAGRFALVRPGHSSQRPHGFLQAVFWLQRGHAVSSSSCLSEHDELTSIVTLEPSVRMTSQHPKQSHPLGVRGAHGPMQLASTSQLPQLPPLAGFSPRRQAAG